MKIVKKRYIGLCLLALFISKIQAAFVLSPTGFVEDPSEYVFEASNMIDGEGISTTFISGSTDFDEFIETNPTVHGDGWMSGEVELPYVVDFDLGDLYIISAIAVWASYHYYEEVPMSISGKSFRFSLSNDSDFSHSTSLGEFEISGNSINASVFDVSQPASGRYLRMEILNTFDSGEDDGLHYVGLGEIVLRAAPIPEPSGFAMGLMAFVIGGTFFRRRSGN